MSDFTRGFLWRLLTAAICTLGLKGRAYAVSLSPGDVLAVDAGSSAATSGIIQVIPASGNRVFATGNSVGSGAAIDLPQFITCTAAGTIYYFETIASGTANCVIAVDASTGVRTKISGGGTGTGTNFVAVTAMCWDPSTATLLLSDAGSSATTSGVIRVDPVTGNRTIVTGYDQNNQGVAIDTPKFVTCSPAGGIYYFETVASGTINCAISVDASTGVRTRISGGGTGTGADFAAVTSMCWDPSTATLLVSDAGSSPTTSGIVRVDPATGNRIFVTGNGAGSGVAIDTPTFVACSNTGIIYYFETLASGTASCVISVNASTGVRTQVSGGGTGTGTAFVSVDALAVVPPPPPAISSSLAASGSYRSVLGTYTITASNSPNSYSATGLPTGLTVNTANGQITGTPTQAGSFNVTIGAANASGTGTATLVLTIAPVTLTVTGITANSKVYNATTAVTLSGSGTLVGVLGGDTVTLGGTAAGVFSAATVGNGKTVTVSGLTISGASSANYALTQPTPTANITVKSLTVSGLGASNKPYDATLNATLTGTAALQAAETPGAGTTSDGKPYTGDMVSLSGTASGVFATKDVGTTKAVTVSGITLAGAQAGNYAVTQPTGLTANITAKTLTVTADNQSRAYGAANPTFTATISGFAGSETSSVLTGSPTVTTAATTASTPGLYAISAAVGSLAANNSNYTFSFVDGTLTITADPRVSWRVAYFGTTSNSGSAADSADPDGDGVVNLLEYALGSDPLTPTADALPVLGTTDVSGSSYLTLAVTRNSAATDLTFTVEATGDLSSSGAWTTSGLVTLVNTSTNLTVRDSTALGASPRFLRLRIAAGVTTTPVGGLQFTLAGGSGSSPANTNTSLPFARPLAWCSAASGVTAQTITVSGAGWAAGRFTSAPYYVELLDGPLAGLTLDITSHTSTTLTLATASLSGYAAGMRFTIRAHATLASAFGATAPSSVAAASTIAAADEVRLYTPAAQVWVTYYYKSGGLGGSGWRSAASTSVDRAAVVVRPEQGVLIVRKSAGARSLFAIGEARTASWIFPIESGSSFLAITQPVPVTLAQLGLLTGNSATGLVGGTTVTGADELLRWNGSTWERLYYSTGGAGGTGWRSSADLSTERGGQAFQPGEVMIVQRKTSGEALFIRPASP